MTGKNSKNKSLLHISDRGFRAVVEKLMKTRWVYGTVRRHGFPAWDDITAFEDLELLQTPTHLSPKEFIFPPREPLVRFDTDDNSAEAVVNSEAQALIGLHSCDIHAIRLMDEVFSHGAKDANYLARREKTLLIGTDCMPDEYCFCTSVGTDEAHSGFDLFLHRVEGGYLVMVGTDAGRKTLAPGRPRPAKEAELNELEKRRLKRRDSFVTKLDIDHKLLPSVYQRSGGSSEWDRIGAICYGCGSCNNVCPTCYCFDVRDEPTPDMKEVERVRYWDGCTLEGFARVAGGHNFRINRAERLKHRFNRKFNYLTDRFKALFCVGCGRCSRTCLVKINIAETTNVLIREATEK